MLSQMVSCCGLACIFSLLTQFSMPYKLSNPSNRSRREASTNVGVEREREAQKSGSRSDVNQVETTKQDLKNQFLFCNRSNRCVKVVFRQNIDRFPVKLLCDSNRVSIQCDHMNGFYSKFFCILSYNRINIGASKWKLKDSEIEREVI